MTTVLTLLFHSQSIYCLKTKYTMRMTNFAIVNLILFGIVFLEVLFLIVLCCLNKQTTKKFSVVW